MAVTVLLSSHWHTLHNGVFPVFLSEDTLCGMGLHSWCHVVTLRGYSAPALTTEQWRRNCSGCSGHGRYTLFYGSFLKK